MSAREVLDQFGAWVLARFVLALLAFLLLHLVRWPFVIVARILDAAMDRVDQAVTSTISTRGTPGTGGGTNRREGARRAGSPSTTRRPHAPGVSG